MVASADSVELEVSITLSAGIQVALASKDAEIEGRSQCKQSNVPLTASSECHYDKSPTRYFRTRL